MAGKTIRQITQLLAAAAVVATAFATSQPVTGLIDPGTRNQDVLQNLDANEPQPCPGFFISPHLFLTARHCVMTHADAANTSVNVGAKTIEGFELLISQADLDFSLLWVNSDVSPEPLKVETPIRAIRTRLIDRLPLLEQTRPTAATELRAALK